LARLPAAFALPGRAHCFASALLALAGFCQLTSERCALRRVVFVLQLTRYFFRARREPED
jgi:hypothetical protein